MDYRYVAITGVVISDFSLWIAARGRLSSRYTQPQWYYYYQRRGPATAFEVRKTPKNNNRAGPASPELIAPRQMSATARETYRRRARTQVLCYIRITAPRMICVDARAKPISTRRRVLIFNGRVAFKTKRRDAESVAARTVNQFLWTLFVAGPCLYNSGDNNNIMYR